MKFDSDAEMIHLVMRPRWVCLKLLNKPFESLLLFLKFFFGIWDEIYATENIYCKTAYVFIEKHWITSQSTYNAMCLLKFVRLLLGKWSWDFRKWGFSIGAASFFNNKSMLKAYLNNVKKIEMQMLQCFSVVKNNFYNIYILTYIPKQVIVCK